MNQESEQKIKDYAFYLISFRPRSIAELKSKLTQFAARKKFPADVVGTALSSLIAGNYVNDETFARWWRDQRASFRPKGKQLILAELLQKGVPRDIAERVLSEEQDAYDAQALQLVEQKRFKWKEKEGELLRKKITTFLSARGFSWDTITRVIDAVAQKDYNRESV